MGEVGELGMEAVGGRDEGTVLCVWGVSMFNRSIYLM